MTGFYNLDQEKNSWNFFESILKCDLKLVRIQRAFSPDIFVLNARNSIQQSDMFIGGGDIFFTQEFDPMVQTWMFIISGTLMVLQLVDHSKVD